MRTQLIKSTKLGLLAGAVCLSFSAPTVLASEWNLLQKHSSDRVQAINLLEMKPININASVQQTLTINSAAGLWQSGVSGAVQAYNTVIYKQGNAFPNVYQSLTISAGPVIFSQNGVTGSVQAANFVGVL